MKINRLVLVEESESNTYVGGTCWTPILEEFKRVFPAKGRALPIPNSAGWVFKFGTLFVQREHVKGWWFRHDRLYLMRISHSSANSGENGSIARSGQAK